MANKILIKRSSSQGSTPTTGQLDLAELAINTYDGRLFAKVDNGSESIVDLTENDTITLVGDASGSGKTTINVALATTGVSSGTYGSKIGANISIPIVTVDTKGRLTSVTEETFSITGEFGNIASQNIDNVSIVGGNIDGTTIGSTVAAEGTFTDLTSTGDLLVNGSAVIVGNLTVQGTVTSVDSTTVSIGDLNIELAKDSANKEQSDGGGITVNLGANGYATLSYTSSTDSWNINKKLVGTQGAEFSGQLTAASLSTTGALNAGQSTLGATQASSLDATPIGQTTPSTGAFTSITANSGNIVTLVATTLSTSSTANVGGALNVTGITNLAAALRVNSVATFTQNVYTTGATVVAGDESIAGKLQVQGAIYKGGYEVLNTADTIDGGTY